MKKEINTNRKEEKIQRKNCISFILIAVLELNKRGKNREEK